MILIYDGDCGPCTKLARFARTRLPESIDVQPWQQVELDQFGLTEIDVRARSYFVDANGQMFGGGQSLIRGAAHMGGAWKLFSYVFRLPVLAQVAEAVYKVVAKNRNRLPGSNATCDVPQSDNERSNKCQNP